MITLRTVLNFTTGLGPVFNVGERVQAYTHPLWFLLLSAVSFAFTDLYRAVFALSLVLAISAYGLLLVRIGTSRAWTLLAAIGLLLSKTFVDFSTSGLENPLAYCFLAAFVGVICSKEAPTTSDIKKGFLVFSLVVLTRQDLAILVLPPIIAACLRAENRVAVIKAALFGLGPLIFWEAFSLLYYGALIPNTALAKLNVLSSHESLVIQGVRYFAESMRSDPVTLALIVASLAFGLVVHQSYFATPLSVGLLLYLVYILSVGGDFMSGRFFSAPLFVAACVLSCMPAPSAAVVITGFTALAYLGLIVRPDAMGSLNGSERRDIGASGIVDERAYYFPGYGLFHQKMPSVTRSDWVRGLGAARDVVYSNCGGVGGFGLLRGPSTHIIDVCALTDPLLARITAREGQRIGHFFRPIPAGYEDSVRRGENVLENPYLRRMYDAILLVSKGDIFSPARLRAIVDLQLGRFADYGRLYVLFDRKQEGAPWDLGTVMLSGSSITLNVDGLLTNPQTIDISLDNNDEYRIDFESHREIVASMHLGPKATGGLARYVEPLPAQVIAKGFDAVTVQAVGGDGMASVGHILFDGAPASAIQK